MEKLTNIKLIPDRALMKTTVQKLLLLVCCSIALNKSYGQSILYIQGDSLIITQGALMHVDGSVSYTAGYVLHDGNMEVTGDWKNFGNYPLFDNSSQGIVRLQGNTQTIKGNTTKFPNLSLEGNNTKILDVNTEVAHTMDLGENELDVNGHDMLMLDNNTGSIQRTTGDVKTSNNNYGRLLRTVAPGNTYQFPMGGGLPYRFRPVTATPDADGVIAVQFQNYDPNSDGYDRRLIQGNFRDINSFFYHTIGWAKGTGNAAVAIAYNTADEGIYNSLAEWYKDHWSLAGYYLDVAQAGESTDHIMQYKLPNDSAVHVLGLAHFIDNHLISVVNAITANNDGKNETFAIFGLENYRSNEVRIFDRWGNMLLDAVNYRNTWKGTGHDIGTYMYLIRVIDFDGREQFIKGDFELLK